MSDFIPLLPNSLSPEEVGALPPLKLFDPRSTSFIESLSAHLMQKKESRTYPELMALAYWMRKANIERIKSYMMSRSQGAFLVPRGTVLHFAPSNVDTIFIYSWFLSLLVGNKNIVRISSKTSVQTEILISSISEVFSQDTHKDVRLMSLLLRYERDQSTTQRLSSVCDVRAIWGGDGTVQEIRKIPIPPTSTEVAFANKYSLAVIGASEWIKASESDRQALAESFYNDSFWFDQMACSSPRLVCWLGDSQSAETASSDFWVRVEKRLKYYDHRYPDVDYVNKLVAADMLSIESNVRICSATNNDIVRVWLEKPALHMNFHCGAGLFFEAVLHSLDDLLPILNRSVQTVSYAAIDPAVFRDFVATKPLAGIDRIVPFGQALDFSPVWDGFDLMRVFTREITIT
jgi:hypothetical protein